MQKQVLQSIYFGDESLRSSFHFYSPLMDLRQTLFLFLEARQEKMERIHEMCLYEIKQSSMKIIFTWTFLFKDLTETYPKAPMNFTSRKSVFISLKLQRPFFKHM